MQNAPIHQRHVYSRIKLSCTIFQKGHPRKIHVKLFQNWASDFREKDFSRISSCPYSARSTHSPEPCLWTYQNFANKFLKGSPKEHSFEFFLNRIGGFREKDFLRISSCSYSAKSLSPYGGHVFPQIKFREQILKRVTQRTSL